MKNEGLKKASGYIRAYRLQKRRKKVVICLAAVVVFCTVYALILPAVTLEKGQALDCAYETHQHEDSCYDAEGSVICGYADYVVHTHDADYCYDGDGNLVCELEEIEEHVHDASCYEEQAVLSCGQEESGGHAHDASCRAFVQGRLVCENTDEGHEHSDECYEWTETTEMVLVCDKPEVILHTHTGDCRDGEGNLICGKLQVEEHTHGNECLSAAAETEGTEETEETEETEGTEGTEETEGTEGTEGTAETGGTAARETAAWTLTETDSADQSQLENDGISLLALLPDTELARGTFGEDDCLTWVVTEDDNGIYTLTISGAGAMPDLANDTAQPWRDYYTKITKIVVGDEVTRIGNNAFKRCFATEVVIGGGVTEIGAQAFGYMTKLEEITIPGNVKTLGTAFQYASILKKVYLEEGIESIDLAGFVGTGIGSSGNTIDIPSTVTTVITSGDSTAYTAGYTVAEGNQYYYTDEYSALYRWNDETRTTATLVGYPTHGSASSYTVPANVTAIAGRAFRSNQTLTQLTIPDTVTGQITQQTFRDSNLVRITLGSAHVITGNASLFVGCSLLEEVVLPDTITYFGTSMFSGCTSLRSLTIGEKVTSLESGSLKSCVSLENVYYNAANCESVITGFGSGAPYYALTIGTEVDALPASFTQLAAHAESITFRGPNYITVAKGALAGGPSALSELSGAIYVDEKGMIYCCESGSAVLVYCPDGLSNVTVPETIRAEDGTELTVNRVDKGAFSDNASLTAVTFEDASLIAGIGERAFYGCTKLTAITDGETGAAASTVTAAKGMFGKSIVGSQAFEGTGLIKDSADVVDSVTEDNMDGQKSLSISPESSNDTMTISVSSGGGTMGWKPQTDEAGNELAVGGYHLLTGDSMNVTISVGNQDGTDKAKYRVYFELTEDSGTLDLTPGRTITINDTYKANCHVTEDSRIVYLEFDSEVGVTFSIPVTANYPNGTSSGGGLRVWGLVVEDDSVEDEAVIAPKGNQTIEAYWTTQRDPFTLTKTNNNTAAVNLTGDGAGGAKLASDLVWKITLLRDAANSNSLGKDYLTSVNLSDTLELPAGISWSQSVLEAVRNGNIRRSGNILYAGDTAIAQLVVGSGTALTGVSASLNEENTITLSGTVRNTSDNSEMPDVTLTATIYAGALSVDLKTFNEDESGHIVTNTANAVLGYMFSDQATETATAVKTLQTSDANVKLTKTATQASYFGEDITYTLTVSNNGTSAYPAAAQSDSSTNKPESISLEDTLNSYTYIKAENIDRMLREAAYKDLTVTITGAVLAGQEKVTGVDGAISWKTSANSSDLDNPVTKATVTVTLAENKTDVVVTVTSEDGISSYTEATAAEALAAAGYAVNNEDTYTVAWQLPDSADGFYLAGGESRVFHIYATAKDTFQLLNQDEPNQYPSSGTLSLTNTAAVYEHYTGSTGSKKAKKTSATSKAIEVSREILLDKSARSGGETLRGGFSAENGEQLEYEIDFTHRGSGVYTDMPLVDDMYGVQYLLVPVEANKNNASLTNAGLKTHTGDDNVEYYILSEGTYRNVVVGTDDAGKVYTADTITVTAAKEETSVGSYRYTGLHTQIKWYYPKISDSGSYQVQVKYQALVDTSLTTSGSYALGNMVWMNDKTASRLYASLWGGGSILDFDKQIVTSRGSTPAGDVTAENKYSPVREGAAVTYRLELTNKGNDSYVLLGSDLADALPNNGDAFTWEKDDISIEVVAPEGVTVSDGIKNGWYLSNEWNKIASTERQQYILWPEIASIQYTGAQSVYIYVTLTFPSDADGGDAEWSNYCDAIGGGFVENILYVYRYSVNVTHNLYEKGEALLQKGVYGTYYYTDAASNSIKFTDTGSRIYYNNKDYRDRAIVYYTLLYNGGNKRLYLDDLYDILPQGFSYKSLVADGSKVGTNTAVTITSTITTVTSGSSMLVSASEAGADEVSCRSAKITKKDRSDGILQFQISGSGEDDSVKYDEELGRYYLDKNEAIVFGYLCDIGESSETSNQAGNTIGMAYYDTLGSGVTTADEISFNGKVTAAYTETNDGSCQLKDGTEAKKSGMPAEEKQQWLISDVTVSRGGIVPGVTKYTQSYTRNGETTLYSGGVMPNDIVNWRVKLQNSGELSITDYTFRDIMPSPYVFTGDVNLTIYDGNGTEIRKMTLFSIKTRSENDKTVTLYYSSAKSEELTIGGDVKELKVSSGNVAVPFGVGFKQEAGNEILTLNLSSRYLSIPEGGFVEITYSSVNPTSNYNNQSYINEAILIPNAQEYDRAAQGTLVSDEDGTIQGVRNYSPVTVSYSYSTRSDKTVEEQGLAEGTVNRAEASDAEENQILLSSTNSVFRYTLKVYNDTFQDMRDLVIIDNLPESGDGSAFDSTVDRGSQFKVSLPENPEVEVKICYTDEDGNPAEYTMTEGEYKLQYSTKTNFTDADWKWTGNAGGWDKAAKDARALRVMIHTTETTGVIPKGAEIQVSFNARIDGTAQPGTTAWNSFGYQYSLDQSIYLSALSLRVGVKALEVPTLQKKLETGSGEALAAAGDIAFRFYVYEGSRLSGSYDSEAELKDALEENRRKYQDFTVTVAAGESASEKLLLTAENWSFVEGETYTIMEAPDTGAYSQSTWNSAKRDSYTFTYDSDTALALTCVNVGHTYELPEAGGFGTIPYTIGGLLLMGAGILLQTLRSFGGRRRGAWPVLRKKLFGIHL